MNHIDLVELINDSEKILKDIKKMEIKFNKMIKKNNQIDSKELERINHILDNASISFKHINNLFIIVGLKILGLEGKQ